MNNINNLAVFINRNRFIKNSIHILSVFLVFEGTGLLFYNKVYAKYDITNKKNEEESSFISYEISPIFGMLTFDSIYDNSFVFGVRPLINITKKYAIEGEIGFSSSKMTATKEGLNIFNYCCDFVYKYPLSKSIFSYGSFGIGGISFLPEDANSDTNFFFNFGGGIKILLKEKITLRIDIRQYAPSVNLGMFSSGNIFGPGTSDKTEVQKILQLNFGLSFLF